MDWDRVVSQQLAVLGGPKAVPNDIPDALFHWPIVTEEDEWAVVEVLRAGSMSGTDITRQLEAEYSAWQGTRYALGYCNGTASLLGAMYGVGLGRGDELIAPSRTYWASALQAFSLGATVVFADIDPVSLCIDPADIERRITPRTKAIMVVHYHAYPADMDPIMDIARRHHLKVIEDVSHAHGTLYKGRMVGAIGDVSAASLMSQKSLAAGEGGILCTDDQCIYERAIAFGHYERHGDSLTLPDLKALAGLPLGGVKHRMNQTVSAMARVQLRHYPERLQEIDSALKRFWGYLAETPGLRVHMPPLESGSTMGAWYMPIAHYAPEHLGGLPAQRFIEAVNAEGGRTGPALNFQLHLHPVFNQADIYHDGKPTRLAFTERDLRQGIGELPVTERVAELVAGVPYFRRDMPEIELFAAAFHKVASQADKLL
ncbi:MAG: DegT/DnrJ/EryC1/StrS family aminotransferase [Chloroflexi bacterium]|nr:DegT/DnrJ/EryC1/StrS family aminotransferase [Chloroflexota bacterium]